MSTAGPAPKRDAHSPISQLNRTWRIRKYVTWPVFCSRLCFRGAKLRLSRWPLQVQAQMQAMQEQMQRPEVQEQMKAAQELMQDKGFAEKVEKLKVSWLAALACTAACILAMLLSCAQLCNVHVMSMFSLRAIFRSQYHLPLHHMLNHGTYTKTVLPVPVHHNGDLCIADLSSL